MLAQSHRILLINKTSFTKVANLLRHIANIYYRMIVKHMLHSVTHTTKSIQSFSTQAFTILYGHDERTT